MQYCSSQQLSHKKKNKKSQCIINNTISYTTAVYVCCLNNIIYVSKNMIRSSHPYIFDILKGDYK